MSAPTSGAGKPLLIHRTGGVTGSLLVAVKRRSELDQLRAPIELSESGVTRTYTSNNGSVQVTADDTPEPGESFTGDEIDAEVARYHDQAAQLFEITPQNDSGNRSYAPGPQSGWGQRTAGPGNAESRPG